MPEQLPELPRPEFTMIRIGSSSEVPESIARELLESGIPGGLIGYEYRPLAEAVFLGEIRQGGLVSIATSGLLGRICIVVATGEIVHIPKVESTMATHVNRDLDSFTRCVAGVIDRFPFYEEDEEQEVFEEVADEVREIIVTIDDTAMVHNGFWDGICEDVAMGDYSNWDD
ncbi:SUKH-4 family immunity protein [Streptomyces sp. NPDC090798]|uniref:SUKH-4 family immunity protein n=1 Tax=Streptomyces sp. NPDC090798 TaxID=3365968 RepID=UPI0037F2EDDD